MVKKILYSFALRILLIFRFHTVAIYKQTTKKFFTFPSFGIFKGFGFYFITQDSETSLKAFEISRYWEFEYCHSILHLTIENFSFSIPTKRERKKWGQNVFLNFHSYISLFIYSISRYLLLPVYQKLLDS